MGGACTCRAVRLGQQPPDAGAHPGPGEVVLVQRLDLRHREGFLHGAGRVHHGYDVEEEGAAAAAG